MQTDFAVEVKDLGLDRGVQGSKAKHTSIQEYYEKLNNYENEPGIEKGLTYEVPEPEFFESKNAYGERVANAMIDQIFDQIGPRFDRAHALASQAEKLKKELSDTKKTLDEIQQRAKPYLDIINEYNHPNLEKEFNKQVTKLKNNFDSQLEHHKFLKREEEQERLNQQRELREQLRLEQEQRKQLAEQERQEEKRLAFLRRQELEKQRKNEPQEPDNNKDNDHSPS
jgi:chromosome segregation ATPase